MPRPQFALRALLVLMLGVAVSVGALTAYGRMVRNAQLEAIEQAIKAGRLKAEDR